MAARAWPMPCICMFWTHIRTWDDKKSKSSKHFLSKVNSKKGETPFVISSQKILKYCKVHCELFAFWYIGRWSEIWGHSCTCKYQLKDVHAFLYAFPFLSWCCLKVSSVKNQEIKCKKMVHTMSANFTNRRISRALLVIFYHINSLTANVVQAGMKNSHPVGFLR